MENQHQKIKGYRDLTQIEIDLMNEVKAKGVELGILVSKVQEYIKIQSRNAEAAVTASNSIEDVAEIARINKAEAGRWASIAKTDLQTGLMALTRSIAQPGFF